MRTALILGGASCLAEDVETALRLGDYSGVVCANDAISWWPHDLDGAVSLHAEKLAAKWLPARLKQGYSRPKLVAAKDPGHSRCIPPLDRYIDPFFPGQIHSGSSGLMAAKMALIDLGFERGVLCGIPMDGQPHFFDDQPWRSAKSHVRGWNEAMPVIKDRLRSVSGITRDWLGAADKEWLST